MKIEKKKSRQVPPVKSNKEVVQKHKAARINPVKSIAAKQLVDIIEHMNDGLVVLDKTWRYVFINHNAAIMLKRQKPSDLIGKHIWTEYPEGLGRPFQIAYEKAMQEQIPIVIEDYYEPWGLWFENRIYPSSDNLLILFTDITERKKDEKLLKERQYFLQKILDTEPGTVYIYDLEEHNSVYVNRYWLLAFGYTEQDMQSAGEELLRQVIHPDDRERVLQHIGTWAQVSEDEVREVQFQACTKLGEWRWLQCREVPFTRNQAGGIKQILGISYDITERKKTDKALRESEEKFSKVFHSSPIPLSISHMPDGRYVDVNDSYLERLGYKREEVIGRTTQEIGVWVDPLEREKMMHVLQQAGSLRNFEGQFRTKSGAVGTALLFREIIEIAGEKHLIGTSLDISERKRAETEIRRLLEGSQRHLKELEALHLIDIAISASMDLKMTLNVLLAHLETLLEVDAADILLFRPALQQFRFAAARGFHTRDVESANVQLGLSFAGRAALERRSVLISGQLSTQSDSHFSQMYEKEGFFAYVGVPLIAKGEIKGVLEVYHRSPHEPKLEWLNLLETLAGRAAIAIDNAQLFDGLQKSNIELALAYDATIEGWSRAMDLRDKETEGHTQRVTALTLNLAQQMGIAGQELLHIRRGALLHDIGKLGVPDSILLKQGELTAEELQVMRQHPILAFNMLSPIIYLKNAIDIPYCHHERWDGTGYPRGLKGQDIPLAARIFSVVDVWDAVTSDRPYRQAWTKEQATKFIRENSGSYFDPQVVDEFLKIIEP